MNDRNNGLTSVVPTKDGIQNSVTDDDAEQYMLSADCKPWHKKNTGLHRSEIKLMLEYMPNARFDFLPNGSMFWAVSSRFTVRGREKDWTLMLVYHDDFPNHDSAKSVDVFLVMPDKDEIMKEMISSGISSDSIPHIITTDDGQSLLALEEMCDLVENTTPSAVKCLKCAVRWIMSFELGLIDKVAWMNFERGVFIGDEQANCSEIRVESRNSADVKETTNSTSEQFSQIDMETNNFTRNRISFWGGIKKGLKEAFMKKGHPAPNNIQEQQHSKGIDLISERNYRVTHHPMSRQGSFARQGAVVRYADGRKSYGNIPHAKCRNIIMSDRAFAQIYNETQDKGSRETGGLLLGHFVDGDWYIIESSDPGYNGVFSHSYHESDEDYANHVCSILSRIYKNPLNFLGMWHRHPGSMDTFSGTDDVTNTKYAKSAGNGCLSFLINKDSKFRITAYYVELTETEIIYTKTDLTVGDSHIRRNDVNDIAMRSDLEKR